MRCLICNKRMKKGKNFCSDECCLEALSRFGINLKKEEKL